jgi:pimeloyl-ACP methyl ester carboxylesterase
MESSSVKTTILFVHGAFHGPECFVKLIPLLKAAGYTSIKNDLKLPSTEPNSASSLQQDIDALRAAALQILDGGDNCVVVMHSYGAVPAAEALQGLSPKERGEKATAVMKMVYLSCNIPKVGDSQLGQMTVSFQELGLSTDLPVEACVFLNTVPFLLRKYSSFK